MENTEHIDSRLQRSIKHFVFKTRRGKLLHTVREHYLRDDVICGAIGCDRCAVIRAKDQLQCTIALGYVQGVEDESLMQEPCLQTMPRRPYIIIDANVVLSQMDVVEHDSMTNVIILETVLEEVRHRNMHLHARLRECIEDERRRFYLFSNEHVADTYVGEKRQGESDNDRNDRALRVATRWYAQHLKENGLASNAPMLITNDRACLRLALDEGIVAKTIHDYIETLAKEENIPTLLDMLVPEGNKDDDDNLSADGQLFDIHWPLPKIEKATVSGTVFKGKLRMNPYNYQEGFVDVRRASNAPKNSSTLDLMSGDMSGGVLIQGRRHLNRGVDGDIVAIEMLPKEQWRAPSHVVASSRAADVENSDDDNENVADEAKNVSEINVSKQPTARVVGIIRRQWRQAVGVFLPPPNAHVAEQSTSALFQPRDRRLPRIRVRTRQWALLCGFHVVVAIDGWSRNSRYPEGHFVRSLQGSGANAHSFENPELETDALLIQHEIPCYPFSDDVLRCLPKAPWSVDESESAEQLSRRLDLRNTCRVLSVDPPGCSDIDDALHIRSLGDNCYEIGVHIADVTHFVRENSALDKEAQNRGTTVYLQDRRIDMLPSLLSTNICSLRPGVDRLAFSSLWKVRIVEGEQRHESVQIVETNFFKTIICSKAALTYEQAQQLIDATRCFEQQQQQENNNNDDVDDDAWIGRDLSMLLRVAQILRHERMQQGALTLASAEVKLLRKNDESAEVDDLALYESRETNHMVEEFMLLANVSVARRTAEMFPQFAMLRRHPIPDEQAFDTLVQCAKQVGVSVDPSTSLTLARSLDAAQLKGMPEFNKLLRILATRCMTQAVYFSSGSVSREEFHHYGLAAPIYTHFTSPIRRYADIVVHRLLAACIGWDTLHGEWDKHNVRHVAEHINMRATQAQQAARDSTMLYTLVFFRHRRVVEDAYVTRVRANGFVVLVPRYGVEGIVYVSDRKSTNVTYVYDDEAQTLSHMSNCVSFCIFQKVRVLIFVDAAKPYDRKLKILCVQPRVGEALEQEYDVDVNGAVSGVSNVSKKSKKHNVNGDGPKLKKIKK